MDQVRINNFMTSAKSWMDLIEKKREVVKSKRRILETEIDPHDDTAKVMRLYSIMISG